MADETLNLTFQQFLAEQKKTNQLLHQQATGDEKGDNIIASARNAAAEIINDSRLAIKNRKEHDETQEKIVKAEKENTKSVESVETAIDKQTKTIENQNTQISARWDEQIKVTKSAATGSIQDLAAFNAKALKALEQYEETKEREMRLLKVNEDQYDSILKQRIDVQRTEKELKEINESLGDAKKNEEYQKKDLQLKRDQAELAARENQTNVEFVKNSAEIAYETREREMRLLKVNEDQYEGILEQRKKVEDSTKKLKELGEAIKGDSKDNKDYQKLDLQLKRDQAVLAARENKRGLLGRFKTTVAASKPVQMLGDVKRKFIDPVKGFFKKFPKILGLALGALLLFFVNSKFYEKTRKFLKKYFSGKESLGAIVTDIALVVGVIVAAGIALKTLGTILSAVAFGKIAAAAGGIGGVGGAFGSKGQKSKGRFGRIASGVARAGTGLLSVFGLSAAAGGAGVAAAQTRSAATPTSPPKAANTNVKPSGSSGMSKFSHLNKFPRLEAIAKRIPFLGTALSAAFLAPILMDDTISKEKKIQAVGAALGGVLGGIGGAKLGALTGAFGGPIGAFVGGILGSVGGFMFGDFVGLKLAEFLMTGKQPNNAAMTGEPVTGDGEKLAPLGRGLTEKQQQDNIKSAAEMMTNSRKSPERVRHLKFLAARGRLGAAEELDKLGIRRYDTPKTLRMKNEAKHFKRLFRPRMMDEDPNTYLDDRRRELERRRLDRMSALPTPAANQVAQMNAATADKFDGGGKSAPPIIITNNSVTEGNTTEQSLSQQQQLVDNSSPGILANLGSFVSGFK